MARTPTRPLRIASELVDQAHDVAYGKTGRDADFSLLARAGFHLIASGAVEAADLDWALERAALVSGWPRKENSA